MVCAIERLGAGIADGVATVGRISAMPGAVNVVPGEVRFSIDSRTPSDAALAGLVAEIDATCAAIASRRGLDFACTPFMQAPATAMDDGLQQALADAAQRVGIAAPRIPSGAGHDAVAMARLCPVGMLFVRCAGGISHNPAESVADPDLGIAVVVMIEAIRAVAETRGR